MKAIQENVQWDNGFVSESVASYNLLIVKYLMKQQVQSLKREPWSREDAGSSWDLCDLGQTALNFPSSGTEQRD